MLRLFLKSLDFECSHLPLDSAGQDISFRKLGSLMWLKFALESFKAPLHHIDESNELHIFLPDSQQLNLLASEASRRRTLPHPATVVGLVAQPVHLFRHSLDLEVHLPHALLLLGQLLDDPVQVQLHDPLGLVIGPHQLLGVRLLPLLGGSPLFALAVALAQRLLLPGLGLGLGLRQGLFPLGLAEQIPLVPELPLVVREIHL
jgi:hypothetical protein